MFFLCTVFHVQPVLELFPGERSLVHSIPQIHLSSNYNQQLQISHITLDTNKPFDPSSSRIKLATKERSPSSLYQLIDENHAISVQLANHITYLGRLSVNFAFDVTSKAPNLSL